MRLRKRRRARPLSHLIGRFVRRVRSGSVSRRAESLIPPSRHPAPHFCYSQAGPGWVYSSLGGGGRYPPRVGAERRRIQPKVDGRYSFSGFRDSPSPSNYHISFRPRLLGMRGQIWEGVVIFLPRRRCHRPLPDTRARRCDFLA